VRRRWKILLLGACGLVVVVAVCFYCLREKEPSYNGRTLSEWLDDAASGISVTGQQGREKAIEAVGKIGTNAVPILLRWSQQSGPYGMKRLLQIAERIPNQRLRSSTVRYLWDRSAERKHLLAFIGFQILGANSTSVIPQVAAQFNTSREWDSIINAAYALSWMGREGVGVLKANFEASDSLKRDAAILAFGNLGYLGINEESPVTALARIVRTHTNAQSRRFAIMSLVKLADVNNSAVPAIEVAMSDPDRSNRQEATNALAAIKLVSRMHNAAAHR
jgi:hypothetical protein